MSQSRFESTKEIPFFTVPFTTSEAISISDGEALIFSSATLPKAGSYGLVGDPSEKLNTILSCNDGYGKVVEGWSDGNWFIKAMFGSRINETQFDCITDRAIEFRYNGPLSDKHDMMYLEKAKKSYRNFYEKYVKVSSLETISTQTTDESADVKIDIESPPVLEPNAASNFGSLHSAIHAADHGIAGFLIGFAESVSANGLELIMQNRGYSIEQRQLARTLLEVSINASFYYVSGSMLPLALRFISKLQTYMEENGFLSNEIRYITDAVMLFITLMSADINQGMLALGNILGRYIGKETVSMLAELHQDVTHKNTRSNAFFPNAPESLNHIGTQARHDLSSTSQPKREKGFWGGLYSQLPKLPSLSESPAESLLSRYEKKFV